MKEFIYIFKSILLVFLFLSCGEDDSSHSEHCSTEIEDQDEINNILSLVFENSNGGIFHDLELAMNAIDELFPIISNDISQNSFPDTIIVDTFISQNFQYNDRIKLRNVSRFYQSLGIDTNIKYNFEISTQSRSNFSNENYEISVLYLLECEVNEAFFGNELSFTIPNNIVFDVGVRPKSNPEICYTFKVFLNSEVILNKYIFSASFPQSIPMSLSYNPIFPNYMDYPMGNFNGTLIME